MKSKCLEKIKCIKCQKKKKKGVKLLFYHLNFGSHNILISQFFEYFNVIYQLTNLMQCLTTQDNTRTGGMRFQGIQREKEFCLNRDVEPSTQRWRQSDWASGKEV